jgi:hypothetical protein
MLLVLVVVVLPSVFKKWNMQNVKRIINTTTITSVFSFYSTIAKLVEKQLKKITSI